MGCSITPPPLQPHGRTRCSPRPVDLVYQFIPVLKANGYHLVTVSQMLGAREPGSSYGARDNGPPANDLHDIAPEEIPSLPDTPSPAPMPNFPITDIPGANSGGPNNGS